ncbi:MAG: glycosyltransferase family 4 protein [Methylomicrobium sp.]
MKSVLIIATSNLKNDPRVYRQLTCLNKAYKITAIGSDSPDLYNVFFIPLVHRGTLITKIKSALMLLTGQFEKYYWSRGYIENILIDVKERNFDFIIANDLITLPIALKISDGKSRVIFDAHEYAPKEFEDRWNWRLFFQKYNHYLCQSYLHKADAMMTVCRGISDEYEREYSVKSVVVTNAPPYQSLAPSLVEDNMIRMIHHGAAIPSRHLENMIQMMDYLDDRFHLDFMLVASNSSYLNKLKKLATHNSRIRFIDPVAMQAIPETCNRYDLGVFLLPPVNFNYAHALPNKIFEFIQARLGVVIGPSLEMQKIVNKYDCGVVAADFNPQSLAESLTHLTAERIRYFKQQSHIAARELCAEHNAQIIRTLIEG